MALQDVVDLIVGDPPLPSGGSNPYILFAPGTSSDPVARVTPDTAVDLVSGGQARLIIPDDKYETVTAAGAVVARVVIGEGSILGGPRTPAFVLVDAGA